MALNFDNPYEIREISSDYRMMHFFTEVNGKPHLLRARIDNEQHFLMPSVFNLSFGPPMADNDTHIDDTILLKHDNLDRVMSTVLLFLYTYLKSNPEHYIGIDGSCDRRALLYFRKIKANTQLLSGLFSIISGVKYYIRLKRFSKPDQRLSPKDQLLIIHDSVRENLDIRDVVPIPEMITEHTALKGMEYNYNYFIFKIK